MIKAIIIDDEGHCRDTLSILLNDYCPEITILEQCSSARLGLEAIENHKPELVFLDIEMPGMNGFEMLEQFKQIPFSVIFTTSYDQYAIKAIRFSALDYLLKPIDPKELIAAVHKVQLQKNPPSADQFQQLLEQIKKKDSELEKITSILDKNNSLRNQAHPSSQQRRLAAILFTDIVGYTSQMQQNETRALAMIKQHVAVLQNAVKLHAGEVLNDYGDSSLCIFSSATEAVQCAIEIQQELQKELVVPLRIGLHIGEVFFEDGKIIGDGVNVASRIQSLGSANTVLFSEEIQDKIKNNPVFKFVPLGSFDFKNVEKPIKVFALTNEGCRAPLKEELDGKTKKTSWMKSFFGIK